MLFPFIYLPNRVSLPLILVLAAPFCIMYSTTSHTQTTLAATNEGLYQVEMIVFKRSGDSGYADDEIWRQDIVLRYPQNYRQLMPTNTARVTTPATVSEDLSYFYTTPQDAHTLGNLRYALQKDRSYQVLFHQAWQQNITEKNTPAVIIQGGDAIGQRRELEGSIQLRVSRYLHIETDLWLTQFLPTSNTDNVLDNSINNSNWLTLPLLPIDGQTVNEPPAAEIKTQYPNNQYDLPIEYIATFREKRRMRSEELHYIDHPILGLLIVITSVEE